MKGFTVLDKDRPLKMYENRAGIFKLLINNEDLELFESNIYPGKSIICQPYESINSTNIIFLLEGKLFHTNERKFVNTGDILFFKDLDVTHHLSVVKQTRLLMVRNSKHFIEQASTTDRIYEMIHQIQEKDQYTEDHSNNTGNLAVQIATMMKLSEKKIQNILLAGKIHDVGKLNIPIEIINKPGKLTVEEFEIVKKHSQYGYDIVMKEIGKNEIAKIVLDHHERLDGSGYPNNLQGDEISIEARIMAVADSYDAMISSRPYKEPISVKDAIEDLRRNVGTWYDKDVVASLVEIINFTKDVNL
ncbi:MAG: HD-GYP domain-containing protein [Clostridia bacterium]|nr:HD-GYP domain-containing protein [Clostridia bacterium]